MNRIKAPARWIIAVSLGLIALAQLSAFALQYTASTTAAEFQPQLVAPIPAASQIELEQVIGCMADFGWDVEESRFLQEGWPAAIQTSGRANKEFVVFDENLTACVQASGLALASLFVV